MYSEKASAKINLALDVIERRPDNYHNLNMVMARIDLFDRLTFNKIPEDKIIISSNKHFLPTDDRNLVYLAVKRMKEQFDIRTGLDIFIDKRIPVAAGLAGGSSDAAAAILTVNKLFKLGLEMAELIKIGQEIGSDVPFCLFGKTAQAEGRGEILTPIEKTPKFWAVLVKPQFGVSTREIFENIDYDDLYHPDVASVIKALKTDDYQLLCQSMGNSLEKVTFRLYPEVADIKNKLLSLGVDAVLMSGSGPTVFGIVKKEQRAKTILNSIDKTKYETFAVRIL